MAGPMKILQRIAQRANRITSRAAELGMTTAEYAVGTVAAVAFAAVLFKVVQSPAVHNALTSIVVSALNVRL